MPISEAPRRLPYTLRKQLEEVLNKLLKISCVEPANSPYASPMVLVKKKDGSVHLCIDCRSITVPDRYPLLRDAIGNQKVVYFTTLDLMHGYHQVKMPDLSRRQHSFVIVIYFSIVELLECYVD